MKIMKNSDFPESVFRFGFSTFFYPKMIYYLYFTFRWHFSSKIPGKTPKNSKFQERLVRFGFPVVDLGGVSRETMEIKTSVFCAVFM